jgi:signal transduction histidine kinase
MTYKNLNIGQDFIGFAQIYYFTLPQLFGWMFFLSAIVTFLFDQKKQRISFFPIVFGLTAIIISTSYYSTFPADVIQAIWLTSVILVSILFLFHFSSISTNRDFVQKLKFLVVFLSGLVAIGYLLLIYNNEQALGLVPERLIILWSGIMLGFALIFAVTHFLKIKNMLDGQFERIMTIGFILSWLPFNVLLFQMVIGSISPITPWILLPFALYPVFIGGAIKLEANKARKNSYSSNLKSIRGILILTCIIGLIILSARLLINSESNNFLEPPLFIGLILFVLPIVFMFLMRENSSGSEIKMATFSKTDVEFGSPALEGKNNFDQQEKIENPYEALRLKIIDYSKAEQYHHFVLDSSNNGFDAFAFQTGKTSDLRFTTDSNLIQYLEKNKSPLMMSDFNFLPPELMDEGEKLALLNANLIIPVFSGNHLAEWLAISKKSLEPAEIEKLMSKINPSIEQYSNVMKSVHHRKDLEQRLSDLDVLTRIVQGVNFTLVLDDIYELIYAQTMQVIPVDDFYIVLNHHQTKTLSYVFFVELDERISEKENLLLIEIQTIEAQVIESGVGLMVNNFSEYCRTRNLPVLYPKMETAMIVPLNTGAITNGCIILGQRDRENRFTESQFALTQSIADLVAGAIEKSRLLEETEQYARQLAILNDLTRKLTSTLEIEEVYRTILQNSVDMVNCEEARLIIADEKNQQFVYQTVIGKQSNELFQHRVPLDYGLIGKSYLSKNQIMINNIDTKQELIDEMESFYQAPINSVMIIPMISKNQVLGLIELVDRLDATGFTNNDQDLLSALAAQAAIALENARLYRRTDQELAKRVDELSVMQRIDRELNTSLDMKKAMELTLTWALRQSGCGAGWIGLISESTIVLMASSGYSEKQLIQVEEKTTFLDFWETGSGKDGFDPIQIEGSAETQLHPKANSQILLPIRREGKMIALMILENFEIRLLDENELNFLVRLCEHASIAIVNSQLYAQVQEANHAKSEFVSLVAHELKNPMTSIKGYTELLASGAVGSITPAQVNFLATIRNNTDRMNTLVSDLNDLTKIEVGSMRMEPEGLDLSEIVNEVVRSTRRQLEEKHQILNLKIDEELPEVWADPDRLLQILSNLVSNAHKYTQTNGEITIIAEKSKDGEGTEPSRNVAHIMVRDNGLGISEKDQQMLFQKFFRSEDDEVRASIGTGLGLNITRSLVEMQGGRIWFESEYKRGTTFHFTLPLTR